MNSSAVRFQVLASLTSFWEGGRLSIFAGTLARGRFVPPVLYGISSRTLFPQFTPEEYLEKLFQTQAQIIQWREKDLSPESNLPLIQRGVELGRETGKLFVVNTFFDLAWKAGADGVHLTGQQDEVQTLEGISRKRSRFLVGKSVHSLSEALKADEAGVDYLLLAPVQSPLSKVSASPALGWQGLREICDKVSCPVFALGGITLEAEKRCIECGAVGVAGISWMAGQIDRQQ